MKKVKRQVVHNMHRRVHGHVYDQTHSDIRDQIRVQICSHIRRDHRDKVWYAIWDQIQSD